jgi:hypothetical protein
MTYTERPDYEQEHCWQYDIRVRNREADLKEAGLTEEDVAELRTSDFEFKAVADRNEEIRCTDFIKRHEWLGNLAMFPTHYFAAYFKGTDLLAGVVVMGMPNGGHTAEDSIERLIQRGACISWSPPYLASAMLSWCMKWMVHNTQFRIFTCYSDPDAREVGTIYQALNFWYLGKTSANPKFEHPQKPGVWITSRYFRNHRMFRVYADEAGIQWDEGCGHMTCDNKPTETCPDVSTHGWDFQRKSGGGGMLWNNVPDEIEADLRERAKEAQKKVQTVPAKAKHRYAYVLGANKGETRRLLRDFLATNKTIPYPKDRGL